RSPAPSAPAPRRAQSPPTPPQAQAPGCATTPRQPQDDGSSAADDPTAALQHQTTPPAPSPQPQAKAGSPPRAHARRCTPHAPQPPPPPPTPLAPAGGGPPPPPPPAAPPPPPPPPPPRRSQPQTHRIVMIKPRLQRQNQISLAHARRHLQQHRLIEAIERTTTLQKPAHDRRRCQSTSGNVRPRARCLPANAGHPSKPRNSLLLNHRT